MRVRYYFRFSLSLSQVLAMSDIFKEKEFCFGLYTAKTFPVLLNIYPELVYFLPTQSNILLGNVHILYLAYFYSICWTKSEY